MLAQDEIRKRQKLIQIADRSPQGWQTVKEYVKDDLCDGPEDEKRLKKVLCSVLSSNHDFHHLVSMFSYRLKKQQLLGKPNQPSLNQGFRLGHALMPFRLCLISVVIFAALGTPRQAQHHTAVHLSESTTAFAFNVESQDTYASTAPPSETSDSSVSNRQYQDSESPSQEPAGRNWEFGDAEILPSGVKGKLKPCLSFWKLELKASEFVLDVIEFGYKIPFVVQPPPFYAKNNRSSLVHPDFVESAIADLLLKHCVIEVPTRPYCCNPLTVAEGKTLRLVLDLRHPNNKVLFIWTQLLFCLLFVFADEWNRLIASLRDPDLTKLATSNLPSLLMGSKAASTTKQYLAAWKKWRNWASSKTGVRIFPVNPFHFSLYISHLAQLGAKSAADFAMAAVKFVHSLAGLSSPTDNSMVVLALQGFKRVTAAPTVRKQPISADILAKNFVAHGHPTASLAELRTLFVIFISYAGFLRFLCDSLTIHLKKAKNDQYRQGAEVTIARTFKATCPVAVAERYFALLGDPIDCNLPLIRRLTNSKRGLIPTSLPLSYTRTRETVLDFIKPFVPDITSYGLHSLRSGGASAACNAHVPPLLISRHGRWRSEKARNVYLQPDSSSKLLPSMSLGI
ncbi:uncharacterized protein [Amphiura filiformis]|uniref:uncharacterized protein n=1 Tax=Amphiura filiformis TaxID=82378 RepID=UPI003B2151B9